jgi:dihydrofolate reductase
MFNAIVATDSENGISKDDNIAWYSPDDLEYFK